MFLVEIIYFLDCLFVSNSKIFYQLPHVFNFLLQVLILTFNHKNFLFTRFLLFNKLVLSLFLRLDFQLHFSIMQHKCTDIFFTSCFVTCKAFLQANQLLLKIFLLFPFFHNLLVEGVLRPR
jgi:hypothetical protein